MFSRKSFSALLTGASLAALAAATGRAAAGTTTTINQPVFNWVTNTDWLNIDSGSVVGTFTNSAEISDGLFNTDFGGAVAVHVRDGAEIDVFVNDGTMFASDNGHPIFGNTSTNDAYAAGLYVDGSVPSTINNGDVGAVAYGYEFDTSDATARGFATGAYFYSSGSGDSTVVDFENNSSVEADGSAFATSLDEEAEAYSGGNGIYVEMEGHDASVSSLITNNDVVDVSSEAQADGEWGAYATAWGEGIAQDFEDVDGGSATAVNNGDVSLTGASTARVEAGYAYAETDVDGIDQEIDVDQSAGLSAIISATNDGGLTVSGSASAYATYSVAAAFSDAAGIEQNAYGGKTLSSTSATNLADISVMSASTVEIDQATYVASYADAAGIRQEASGGYDDADGQSAVAFADNQGSMDVTATAAASGTYIADSPGAYAFAAGIDQGVYQAMSLSATAMNSASMSVTAEASNHFVIGTYAGAGAFAVGVNQDLDNDDEIGGTGFASFVNSGSVTVQAMSTSQLDYAYFAVSNAYAVGAVQNVTDVDSATIEFENEAGASISANADSFASSMIAMSEASAFGVNQYGYSPYEMSSADLTATNLGTMTVGSVSEAAGTYIAEAGARAVGIAQDGDSDNTTLLATNSGSLSVSAQSMSTVVEGELGAPSLAAAYTTYVGGIAQDAYGRDIASATASNSGSIGVLASSQASAATYAAARSFSFGVIQEVDGLDATASFENSSVVSVGATAQAKADGIALANAGALGVSQNVEGYDYQGSAVASLTNSDSIMADAQATAGGLLAAQATYAMAGANAVGADQYVGYADTGAAGLTNSGTLAATASAGATGDIAFANADAVGYEVYAGSLNDSAAVSLLNDKTGSIWSLAEATADGSEVAAAYAWAAGVDIGGDYGMIPLEIDAVNKGLIAASALSTASGNGIDEMAYAYAVGVAFEAGELTGSFKNSGAGVISASAIADSANSEAMAVGIDAYSDSNGMLVLNKGTIVAYAEGVSADATGIRIGGVPTMIEMGPPTAPLPSTAVATIENHGDIWAGVSTDGGDTILRGNAINTQYAPNAVTILLENDQPANIFGNIEISDDDQIISQNGTTKFDGVINPDMALEGGLTIRSGGKFVMLNNNDLEGPSKAYVNTFTMGKNGTLQLNLTPDNSAGAYPTIMTNTATLKGKLKASYSGTFFGNTTVYENVIDADTRNGRFDKVVDNSILLDTKALYDDQGNVDLKAKRVAFGDVPGLTENQTAAGDGIEKVYGDLPNKGPFSQIVKDLFSLNGMQYAAALDQLAGAEYAQLMQSVVGSTGQLNASITDRMECAIQTNLQDQGADARKGCFDPNKVQVWARVGGTWNTSDGDIEAPGYDENQTSIYIGGDYAINTNVFVGAAGGYFSSSMDFDDWGGRNGASMNYDGGQIALYGGYDDGTWYGRNILSYGFYSGDSRRDFGITTSPQALTGDYNTNVVSYYGEAGRRFQVMENVEATPFLGLGLASAGIDSFTEKDPHNTGAALRIRGSDASSVESTLGFRVAGHWGGFRPEATIAWQHQFADARQTVDMAFADAPKGANFSVISSDPGSDALLLGLGASYSVTPSSVITLRYDGAFWSGYNSQALSARWTSKF